MTWGFLSLRVFGQLSSSLLLLLFPQRFGRYVLRPSIFPKSLLKTYGGVMLWLYEFYVSILLLKLLCVIIIIIIKHKAAEIDIPSSKFRLSRNMYFLVVLQIPAAWLLIVRSSTGVPCLPYKSKQFYRELSPHWLSTNVDSCQIGLRFASHTSWFLHKRSL